ncbi:MAG: glycosyltransferase family 2 protein [Victivallaceae bacterium]|nr:glycosyltransferase family 2 protein [Victivallaceae bacterium]
MDLECKNKLSVIIPVYNEENTVVELVKQVLARPAVGEIIIVNDASTDGTAEQLKKLADIVKVRIFTQEKNMGKGAAIIRAIPEVTRDFVIIQDADFEYDPDDYPLILAPLIHDKADVVYGSRFMGTPGQVRYFRHEMGNKFLTFCSNLLSDIHLSDMETCYKCFRREILQNLNLTSQRFGIEVEFTAKLAKSRRLRIWEVPISYNPRKYNEGKKITWKDGISAIYHIIKFNLFSRKAEFYKRPWDEVLNQEKRDV